MGKPTGFIEYKREKAKEVAPLKRIKTGRNMHPNFRMNLFVNKVQDAWIVELHFAIWVLKSEVRQLGAQLIT